MGNRSTTTAKPGSVAVGLYAYHMPAASRASPKYVTLFTATWSVGKPSCVQACASCALGVPASASQWHTWGCIAAHSERISGPNRGSRQHMVGPAWGCELTAGHSLGERSLRLHGTLKLNVLVTYILLRNEGYRAMDACHTAPPYGACTQQQPAPSHTSKHLCVIGALRPEPDSATPC